MRRSLRFVLGVALGAGTLVASLRFVGVDAVLDRVTAVAPWAAGVVLALAVVEALADGIGVWASVRPLGEGLSPAGSAQFALAGDFFDTLSPAGPVTSEPIMSQFIAVATGTTYSEALAVRSVAKYVKSLAQVTLSAAIALVVLAGDPAESARFVVLSLCGAVLALLVLGAVLVRFRAAVSTLAVVLLAPVVGRLSALYREDPHDRATVERAVERFGARVGVFRSEPALLALIALGGLVEQLLVAAALWTALAAGGTEALFLPVLAVVPLPQVASVVPVPASLGTYDVFLGGVLVVLAGVPSVASAAAVLLVRTATLAVSLAGGGLAVAFLRGWGLP